MGKVMAEFKVKTSTGEMLARTCETCKGLGYLTAPLTFERNIYYPKRSTHIHRAESGDRCPFCLGKGWTGVAGGEPRDLSKLSEQP
jgi:hypothetical protein